MREAEIGEVTVVSFIVERITDVKDENGTQ